jgi:O-antigen/teichoic acid export membrane protein
MFTLKKQAIQGMVWIIAGYGISQFVRLSSNLILTRMLVPEIFGLMALMHAFVIGLSMFSDIGIGPSIIQNKRGNDPIFLNTAWTMQFIRGIILWLLCLIISWPASIFYKDDRILWILPIISLTTVIGGLNSTAIFTLHKHLHVGKLTSLELVSQIISTVVMVLWAWVSPSIWALIVGNLVASVIHMIWSHQLISNYYNNFSWDSMAAKDVLSFGKWVFFSTAMTFLSVQADNLILGKIFPLELLGVYIIASTFANIPRQIIGQLSSKLIYPIMSAQIHLQRRVLRSKIIEKRRLILLLVTPFLAILTGFGDLLILTLYDERYALGSWMLPLLAIGLWPRVLTYTIDPVFLALGRPIYTAYGSLLVFIVLVTGVPLAFYFSGIVFAITLIASKELVFYMVVYYGLKKEKMTVVWQDVISTLLLLALTGLILEVRQFFGFGNPFHLFHKGFV